MDTVSTVGEAVARIAYLSSDVIISVQPSLQRPSEFSTTLHTLAAKAQPGLVAQKPSVQAIRHNVDPLLSVFEPTRSGKFVSVTTPSTILLASIPHLYKLAQYPVVIHVALHPHGSPDYSVITAIRQCGFTFLQSETLREGQDMALSAHALAIQSGKGVIHFFDPTNSKGDHPRDAEDPQLIRSMLDMGAVKAFQSTTSQESSLYVEEGRQVHITEVSGLSNGQPQKSLPPVKPTASPSKSTSPTQSPTGSSARNSSVDSRPTISSATSVDSVTSRHLTSEDIYRMVSTIWDRLASITGRMYYPFEYTGPEDADSAIFIFGSTGMFVDAILSAQSSNEFAKCAIVTARLYRPWIATSLTASIPKSIKKIAVLEQIKRKTTKWGPVLIDILTSLRMGPSTGDAPIIVGHQLGHIETSTARQALRGIFQNLSSPQPIQNLEVGSKQAVTSRTNIFGLEQPQTETAYMKILDQVFGSNLYVANRIRSENAGISAQIAANPEFGFGSLLARIEHRKRFARRIEEASSSSDFITEAPKLWLSEWAKVANDPVKSSLLTEDIVARLQTDGSSLATQLLEEKALFSRESQWLIGSDAWSYDLGNSGVHHVLASGENINMLIIDSQPYSERAATDAVRRKKDIGLYAMNFGNAYVASVAVYSSYTQVLEAMIEADRFNGPSVVVAYLPYFKEDDSALTVLQETKKAVDLGYWPLYRWDPSNEERGEPNFTLDSERLKRELEQFLKRDNQLTQLMNRHPRLASNLSESYGTEVRKLQKRRAKDAYEQMLDSLAGAPLTVLYASDNDNAKNLAQRLHKRGKARGLKAKEFAMDDYPFEDLATEENVVLITSTAGQGEFPQNGRAFWDFVKDTQELDLSSINYTVFALGDSHYWPRKEDRIYYNKPGKDLDNRINFLGGKQLVETGLGDDQDPDGYHTGYNEWEPKLWSALGVDNVEGLPAEPEPRTNENIKEESNYLRGTIAEGLEDPSTGAIAADDQQLTKFHGTYMQHDRDTVDDRKAQGLEPAYAFMIRCRLSAGVATPTQWLKMDAISDDLGNHTMKMTTRQTFQFHGVIKSKLKPAMRAINKAAMTTIAACGDVNRNVMCSVLPYQSSFHSEVYEASKKISDHLLPSTTAYHEIWLQDSTTGKKVQVAGDAIVDHEPLYGHLYLPRKFKITIAVPPHNDTDVYAHDIGLIAIKGSDGRLEGFNVLAGGGMGMTHNNKKTYPRTGSMLGFVPTDQVHIVCEKIMLVQKDHGDRKNRKHARLKYTMDDMGDAVFKSKVEERLLTVQSLLPLAFHPPRPFHFSSNIDTFGWQRDEQGYNHYTFFIENGRVEDTPDFPMKTGLREIATFLSREGEKKQKGEFRLTPNQHICLSRIHDSDLDTIKGLIKTYKLDNIAQSGLRLSSSACVAFPTCGLAMAESERYLPHLITKLESTLERHGLEHDSIVMRMTGCPNGCARPWLAEVAFVGKAPGTYNMYLGGGYHGQRLNKLYRSSIQEEEILEILKPMLGQYAKERTEGEKFGDWTIRAGYIKPTTEGKAFHLDVAYEDEEE